MPAGKSGDDDVTEKQTKTHDYVMIVRFICVNFLKYPHV